MKHATVYRIAWILVGCLFAEAAFLLVQVGLTLSFSQAPHSLPDLLAADNPLYAVPPYFHVIGAVFLLTVLFGEWRHYNRPGYYLMAGLVTALSYYLALWFGHHAIKVEGIAINIVAAAISGLVYWLIAARRHPRRRTKKRR